MTKSVLVTVVVAVVSFAVGSSLADAPPPAPARYAVSSSDPLVETSVGGAPVSSHEAAVDAQESPSDVEAQRGRAAVAPLDSRAATSDSDVASSTRRSETADDLRVALRRAQRDHALELARCEATIGMLEARIHDLTRKVDRTYESVARADGRVVEVLPDGQVRIDLGLVHGVRRGVRFELYDEPGGWARVKAIVEVRDAEPMSARCAVVSVGEYVDLATGEEAPLSGDPPAVGDLVRSPWVEPGASRSCVVLGQRPVGPLPLSELVARLLAVGMSVRERVEIETDVVVLLGDGETTHPEEVRRARAFGLVFMTEGEALHLLGEGPAQER